MKSNSLTPMLFQYLVGLCCLKWDTNAVEATIGDMVLDNAAKKERDVDVTVCIREGNRITHAFKGYEVKQDNRPLDVAITEQLCQKFSDMPSITHKAIVSFSGFTEGAVSKATHHGVALYKFSPWTRPLKDQFPALAMEGTAEEHFPANKFLLCWSNQQISLIARSANGIFQINDNDTIYDRKGKAHRKFKTYRQFEDEILLRSTETLYNIDPATTVLRTFSIPFTVPRGQIAASPSWPHTHTIDVFSDEVYLETGKGRHKLDHVTVSGHLHWQRSIDPFLYYVMECVQSGKPFAGALISLGSREGQMTCLVFSPKTNSIGVEFVTLSERHQKSIRDLKLGIREEN